MTWQANSSPGLPSSRPTRGSGRQSSRPSIRGRELVATQAGVFGPRFAAYAKPAIVNGGAGLYLGPAERPAAVVGFTVVGGRIAAIDLVVDREKLRQVVGA